MTNFVRKAVMSVILLVRLRKVTIGTSCSLLVSSSLSRTHMPVMDVQSFWQQPFWQLLAECAFCSPRLNFLLYGFHIWLPGLLSLALLPSPWLGSSVWLRLQFLPGSHVTYRQSEVNFEYIHIYSSCDLSVSGVVIQQKLVTKSLCYTVLFNNLLANKWSRS